MSPSTIELFLEVIKELGPVFFTALVGIASTIFAYKAGKAQIEIRLNELDKNNEFKAREHIFSSYRERGNQLREKSGLVGKTLGELLGTLRALEGKDKELILSFALESIQHLVEAVPIDIEQTKKELQENDMVEYLQFKHVETFAQKLKDFKRTTDEEILLNTALTLSEIYALLNSCNVLVVEKRGEKLFDKYLNS